MKLRYKAGFTLIELSIVLVIIGLILGGVVGGKALIEAANIRKQVATFEQYIAATNSFRIKYNCLPGDCRYASDVGLGTISGNANGNGDGSICSGPGVDACEPAYGMSPQSWHENINYWYHMYQAFLIPPVTCVTDLNEPQCSSPFIWNNGYYTPKAGIPCRSEALGKCGVMLYSTAYSNLQAGSDGTKYNHVYYFSDGATSYDTPIRGEDVRAIDIKIDDGKPGLGRIMAKYISSEQEMRLRSEWTACVSSNNNSTAVYQDVLNGGTSPFNCVMVVGTSF